MRITSDDIQSKAGFRAGFAIYQGIERGQIVTEYNRRKALFLKGQAAFRQAKTVIVIDKTDILTIFAGLLAVEKRAMEWGMLIIPLKAEDIEPALITAFRTWKPGAWLADMMPVDVAPIEVKPSAPVPALAGWRDVRVYFTGGDDHFQISIPGKEKQQISFGDVFSTRAKSQQELFSKILWGFDVFQDLSRARTPKEKEQMQARITKPLKRLNATLNNYFGLNGDAIQKNGHPNFILKTS